MTDNVKSETKDRLGSFRLPDATYQRLEEVAEADDRAVSYIVRLAIEQYLNRRKAA